MKEQDIEYSKVLVRLFKGIIYREDDEGLWQELLKRQGAVMDYFALVGLDLVLSEEEGFGFLKTRAEEEAADIPKLIPRRQLSYPVSLILALLRRKFAEHDASSPDPRLIMDREELVKLVETFLQKGNNEVQWLARFDGYLNRVQDLGFIRYLGENGQKLEVRRILKVFIDAQWLAEFDQRLTEYRAFDYGAKGGSDSDRGE
jgi:hypothetical protein